PPARTRRSRPRGPPRLSAGRAIRTLKGRSPRVFETRAVTRFRHPGVPPSLGARVLGPIKNPVALEIAGAHSCLRRRSRRLVDPYREWTIASGGVDDRISRYRRETGRRPTEACSLVDRSR